MGGGTLTPRVVGVGHEFYAGLVIHRYYIALQIQVKPVNVPLILSVGVLAVGDA